MISKKFLEKIPCNLCGSKEFSIVYKERYEDEKDHDLTQKFRASGDELLIDRLVKCKNCGLIFINPRIKSNVIVESYSRGEDPLFVSQAESRERTFKLSLRKMEKRFKKRGRILDVGTAGGSFLGAAKKRGWEVYGCEPNKWLADWGNKKYGIKIDKGTIFEQKYGSNFFDVVSLWDVIEHTPDPLSVLKECNRVLKPKGYLIINYPDIGSWIARLMGRKWLFLTSVHLYYFTRKTISDILNKAGFEIIQIKPHFQELELGYIFFRGQKYSKILGKTGEGFSHLLGIESKPVPYWLGQTFIMARKIK